MAHGDAVRSALWPVCNVGQAHTVLTAPGGLFETEDRTIRGVPTTVFKYAPTTLLDVFTAAR
ncbi:hypothetical protein, partial [Rhodococcus jostii]|uniref:hypothetical protein n=1 Tax=Rhodococcus jostii TaxID=132919 RepID=UPI00362E703A